MKTKQHLEQEAEKERSLKFIQERTVGEVLYLVGDIDDDNEFRDETFKIHTMTIEKIPNMSKIHPNKISDESIQCKMPEKYVADEETARGVWQRLTTAKLIEEEAFESYYEKRLHTKVFIYPFGQHQSVIFFKLNDAKKYRINLLKNEIFRLKNEILWHKEQIKKEQEELLTLFS